MSRRWLQFSLRGFLLATTAFAIWLGLVAEKAMRQKEAVVLLEDWGARIDYDYDWQGPSKPPKKASPRGWPWMRKLLGSHYFDRVVNVELISGNRLFTAVETAAARKGKALSSPRLLELTDAETAAFGHLPHLRRLYVSGDFKASETGLRRLKNLTQLEDLMLDNTSGRSVGGITDETLTFIERMPALTTLYLEGHAITDAGLANVRWPPGLVEMDLSGTKLTDAGLAHLKSITTLRRLVLMDCRVSDAGIADLHRALPRCKVVTGR